MEHVDALREFRGLMQSAGLSTRAATLDAAIASLSAPQPPAEVQPVWVVVVCLESLEASA